MVYFNTILNASIYNYLKGVNPLNAELNSICHLLALSGAHPIFRVSRIRVNVYGNMFLLYIQPSSDLKEISPDTKVCFMESHTVYKFVKYMGFHKVHTSVPGLISLRPDDG